MEAGLTELNEDDINKVLWHYQATLVDLMKPLRLYGQGDYVDSVLSEMVKLGWQLHWKLEGIDEAPFEYNVPHW